MDVVRVSEGCVVPSLAGAAEQQSCPPQLILAAQIDDSNAGTFRNFHK